MHCSIALKRAIIRYCLAIILVLTLSAPSFATTYVTWLMIWRDSKQSWWLPNTPPLTFVNGEWKTIDWYDSKQLEEYLDNVKNAGVSVVIADLTNGWGWLDSRCLLMQSLCAKKGLKFCIAENSSGNTTTFEAHSKNIWDKFAGPSAQYRDTYFQYRGKPLIVCYGVRTWYNTYLAMTTPYRSNFNLVWTSGEDSNVNKWGWQLEPWVGVIPSSDSMFVTSAVKWNSTHWRKSLAWLDYNFALAKQNNPEYVIVGSYDDTAERNAWLVTDTSGVAAGRQMRDKSGALSTTAHYDRVTQWISGRPTSQPGGLLKDGAYRMINCGNSKELGVPISTDRGIPGAALGATTGNQAPMGLCWLYHLGGNRYRVIVLSSGLAIESTDGTTVLQNWENANDTQRWVLNKVGNDIYRFRNLSSGGMLSFNATGVATLVPRANNTSQQWQLQPVMTL